MHIWTLTNWQEKYIPYDPDRRRGIRIIFDKDVDVEVRRACKEFCKWLRKEYIFPKRVAIYIKAAETIRARDGDLVSATILLPIDKDAEPYMKIATGDYIKMMNSKGKDNALAAILRTIAHELTHYFQWLNDIEMTDMGQERQATKYADYILDEYAETREHP